MFLLRRLGWRLSLPGALPPLLALRHPVLAEVWRGRQEAVGAAQVRRRGAGAGGPANNAA